MVQIFLCTENWQVNYLLIKLSIHFKLLLKLSDLLLLKLFIICTSCLLHYLYTCPLIGREDTVSALPLLEGSVSALPLLEGSVSALPLLEGSVSALPLLEGSVSALPLLEGSAAGGNPSQESLA